MWLTFEWFKVRFNSRKQWIAGASEYSSCPPMSKAKWSKQRLIKCERHDVRLEVRRKKVLILKLLIQTQHGEIQAVKTAVIRIHRDSWWALSSSQVGIGTSSLTLKKMDFFFKCKVTIPEIIEYLKNCSIENWKFETNLIYFTKAKVTLISKTRIYNFSWFIFFLGVCFMSNLIKIQDLSFLLEDPTFKNQEG